MNALRAPYPYFGGKRLVVDVVWSAFGPRINNYVEPFCGSAAMLLGRPGGAGKIETVNDAFGAIPNFWRAVKLDPEGVAEWCDWPVSEVDMHARHVWLVRRFEEILPTLRTDPEFFDVKAAGWWLYGQCIWIGGGWCGGIKRGHPRPNLNDGQGVFSPGRRPHVSSAGKGVGVSAPPALDWMRQLSERLRRVRIVCGDWTRVLGPSVLGKGKNVGGRRPCAVFLDPPYSHELRDPGLYAEDDASISAQVGDWAREHGDDPDLRIALCGYEVEHDMPDSWTCHAWKAARGYAGEGNDNASKERIWFSPHCLPIGEQASLFGKEASS